MNQREMEAKGITKQAVEEIARGNQGEEEVRNKVRRRFQRVATSMNMKHFEQNWEARVEKNMARWKLGRNERRWRDAFMRNMADIGELVAPQAAAAV